MCMKSHGNLTKLHLRSVPANKFLNTLADGNSLVDLDRNRRGSAVLLLHLGELNSSDPDHLKSRLSAFYGTDRWKFLRFTIDYLPRYRLLNGRFNRHAAQFDCHSLEFRQTIAAQQRLLQPTLDKLLPELAPFRCSTAFVFSRPTVEDAIAELRSDPVDRVFLVPLYPHYWCFQTGTCVNRITTSLRNCSVAVDSDQHLRGFTGTAEQFQPASPTRWSLIDRWPAHPALTDAYAKLITSELRYFPYDVEREVAILFCAPTQSGFDAETYRSEISASCLRIAEAVGGDHPYQLAWMRSWDNTWPSFPQWNGLLSGVNRLLKQNRTNILVVPLTYVAGCYDTEVVLPRLLPESALKRLGAHHLRILSPPNVSGVFIQGLAELVKNHHLSGAKCSPQYSLKCHNCSNANCRQSRITFK